ncbi:hypothetical protein SCHPADRAFT_615544 [Schizopora paradoxa]|uniref:Uncharacterized protein n=1 Tax=Schizopora paradoxa TaxID=27342 RepID=A0A0H2RTU1_9AGAM|nr:hypothetical protein SCHPADRAFT_615544 [Schizopora paradoxa]
MVGGLAGVGWCADEEEEGRRETRRDSASLFFDAAEASFQLRIAFPCSYPVKRSLSSRNSNVAVGVKVWNRNTRVKRIERNGVAFIRELCASCRVVSVASVGSRPPFLAPPGSTSRHPPMQWGGVINIPSSSLYPSLRRRSSSSLPLFLVLLSFTAANPSRHWRFEHDRALSWPSERERRRMVLLSLTAMCDFKTHAVGENLDLVWAALA